MTYSSDLTDAQRQQPRKHHPRTILNALFYLNKTGCQWRLLPQGEGGFPPWQTVYYHFRRWIATGRLTDALRWACRVIAGRDASPSLVLVDTQSVKTSHVGGVRGFDGGKLIQGRKRHIATNTLGLLLAVLVHSAGIRDSQRLPHLLARLRGKVPRMEVILADSGYEGTPAELVRRCFG